jgi:hypothetical protein
MRQDVELDASAIEHVAAVAVQIQPARPIRFHIPPGHAPLGEQGHEIVGQGQRQHGSARIDVPFELDTIFLGLAQINILCFQAQPGKNIHSDKALAGRHIVIEIRHVLGKFDVAIGNFQILRGGIDIAGANIGTKHVIRLGSQRQHAAQ